MVHSGNGIVFSTKKRRATKPWKDMEEPSMYITKWKKPIWKRFQPYDILEKVKLWRQHKDQWLSGVRVGGGMKRQSTEGFLGHETPLYNITMVDVFNYTLHICPNPQNTQHWGANSTAKYGLWVMMCHCRFINCNKHITLVGDVDDDRAMNV